MASIVPDAATPYGFGSDETTSTSALETAAASSSSASAALASRSTRADFSLVSSSSEMPITRGLAPSAANPAINPACVLLLPVQ
jgi:hypothetical protein